MRYGAWSLVVFSALGLAGCGWLPGSSKTESAGGIAVVDLDEVAKSLGVDTRISDMIEARKKVLHNELGKVQTDLKSGLQTELEDVKAKFNDEVPAEEAQELRKKTLEANATVQRAISNANQNLTSFAEGLKQRFRTEVRPIAQEIASKKGFSIVIPKNDGLLLSVSPANDITSEVILAMQDRNRAAMAAAKPPAEEKPAAEAKPPKKTEKRTAEATREKKPAGEVIE
jgi:Skp family chaperone for outer membrane proteins